MQGTIITTVRDDATVHTYISPDMGGAVNTHLIELPTQLIAVDAQYGLPFAQEVVDYAKTLGKPITRLYVSHDHPDHHFGAALFSAPAYALADTKAAIESTGDAAAAASHAQLGSFVPEQATKPEHTVETGEEVIDGVRFTFTEVAGAETGTSLVIALPDQGIVLAQDLVYNDVHLFIADRNFDGWAAAVETLRAQAYPTILPGHGAPGGPELYDQVLHYLQVARAAYEKAGDGEALKAMLLEAFPSHGGTMFLDVQNRYLYPVAG